MTMDEPTIRQRFDRAFAPLRASETTLDDVRRRLDLPAEAGRGGADAPGVPRTHRRHRMPRRRMAAVLLAAALAVGCGAAYATGALQRIIAQLSLVEKTPGAMVEAYSDAISDEPAEMLSAAGDPIALPRMTRPDAGDVDADGIIGAYVSAADATVAVGNWTCTLDSFVADENGFAALAFTMENPNGVDAWYDAGYGTVAIDPDSDLGGLDFRVLEADGSPVEPSVNYRFVCVERTGTAIRLAAYLSVPDAVGFGNGRTLEMTVSAVDRASVDAGTDRPDALAGSVIAIEPAALAPCTTLASDDGRTARVSPLGMFYETTGLGWDEFLADEIVVAFADSSEYVVTSESDDLDNTLFGTAVGSNGDGGLDRYWIVFNRLVDTDQVAGVLIEGRYCNGVVDEGAEAEVGAVSFVYRPEA